MIAMALAIIIALGAEALVMIIAYHVVEEDMKNVLVATGQEKKDVIHVLGMDMISTVTNVPGAGAKDIKNAFPAMVMEEKNVSHVMAEAIKIAFHVGEKDMIIVIIAMVMVLLNASGAMVMAS